MLKSLDERLDLLTKAIMDDAQGDAEQVRADAQAQADEILRDAKVQAEETRKSVLDHAEQEAATLKEEKVSEGKMKAQMLWLERREALLDKVFQEASKRIPNLCKTDAYPASLDLLTEEAVINLQSDVIVLHFDHCSQRFFSEEKAVQLGEKLHKSVTIGESLVQGTGVVAETEDGHRQFDNTLEIRLARQQQQLRATVYHILMGENV